MDFRERFHTIWNNLAELIILVYDKILVDGFVFDSTYLVPLNRKLVVFHGFTSAYLYACASLFTTASDFLEQPDQNEVTCRFNSNK
jgi:hypothetical protein